MDYYSQYAQPWEEERGYPSSMARLLWRLDDLWDRYDALCREDAPYRNGKVLSEDELRFVLPADLDTAEQVEGAIRLAQEDLYTDHGIDVTVPPQEDDTWENQLCLFTMPSLLLVA